MAKSRRKQIGKESAANSLSPSSEEQLSKAQLLQRQRDAEKSERRKQRAARKAALAGKYPTTPYYNPELVPKDPLENIRWRMLWREAAIHDKGLRKAFQQAAFEDVLFWFNAFCWCFEPRSRLKVRPFVTWPHQDGAIVEMDDAITRSENSEEPIDVVLDKSRGQGATWMFLMIFLRRWLRDYMFSAGLVTRTEDLVDSLRDPDTLMWKIVWMIGRLPRWMLPPDFNLSKHRNLSEHSLINPENHSTIVGYSAVSDMARGGRKTVFAKDELAAFKAGEDYSAMNNTQHVTNCRFLVSTFKGDSGAYYESATGDNDAVKVVLDWRDNPTQNKKLYRMVHGNIFLLNEDEKLFPHEYQTIHKQHARLKRRGYKVENCVRNIWYNSQCLRPGATPYGIASELDRNPHGSVAKVFDAEVLKEAREKHVRPPVVAGRFSYDPETGYPQRPYIVPGEGGELKLWCELDYDGNVPDGTYVIGIDISAGTAGSHSSNSTACVINKYTGEQVAEFASNAIIPMRYAYLCAALGRWFGDAELVPEANFAPKFMEVLVEDLHYPNIYYREVDIVGQHKKTKKPGFWMKDDMARLSLFNSLQEAMADGAFTPRSEELIKECPEYEWKQGKIIHVASTKSEDHASKGKAHGDRVIGASLGWLRCSQPVILDDTGEERPAEIPRGSMADRLREYDEQNFATNDPWEQDGLDIFASSTIQSWEEYR